MQCNKNCDISEHKISTQPRKACSVCILFSRTLAVSDFLPELQPCCSNKRLLMPASLHDSEFTSVESLRSSPRFKTAPVWSLLPAWRFSGLSWAPVSTCIYLQDFTHLTKGVFVCDLASRNSRKVCFIPGRQHCRSGDRRAQSKGRWAKCNMVREFMRTPQDTHAPDIQRCRSFVRWKHIANHCKWRTLLLGWRMLPVILPSFLLFWYLWLQSAKWTEELLVQLAEKASCRLSQHVTTPQKMSCSRVSRDL